MTKADQKFWPAMGRFPDATFSGLRAPLLNVLALVADEPAEWGPIADRIGISKRVRVLDRLISLANRQLVETVRDPAVNHPRNPSRWFITPAGRAALECAGVARQTP